jgi:hypothetical protein
VTTLRRDTGIRPFNQLAFSPVHLVPLHAKLHLPECQSSADTRAACLSTMPIELDPDVRSARLAKSVAVFFLRP